MILSSLTLAESTFTNVSIRGILNVSNSSYTMDVSSPVIFRSTTTYNGLASFNRDVIFFGNFTLTNISTVNGSFIPTTDAIHRLGNGSNRWLSGNFSGDIQANNFFGIGFSSTTLNTSGFTLLATSNSVAINKTVANFALDVSGRINATAIITANVTDANCAIGEIRGNTTAEKLCLCTAVNTWKCVAVT